MPASLQIGLAAIMAAGAVQASAPTQTPYARQQLADLAYLLGETHALARTCRGPSDLRWRAHMNRLLELEAQDLAFRHRLSDSFNAGFVFRQAEFRTCSADARTAQRTTATKGAALARNLAESTP